MEISVQVSEADGSWSTLNSERIRPGMTIDERAEAASRIASLYDGWLTSDYTKGRNVRLHVRDLDNG